MKFYKTITLAGQKDNRNLSEFKIQFLATMAFPSLFPDCKGDLTNAATWCNLTLGEKIKHLIKFDEKINGKWQYRFAAHLSVTRLTKCVTFLS